MSSGRLKANTPGKWGEANPALEYFKLFILISLLAFGVLLAIFLVVYLIKPFEVRVFIRTLEEWIT
jgi:hypothetical protein